MEELKIKEVLDKIPFLTLQVKNNIISKTIISNECWLYTGALSQGYPRIYYMNRLEFLTRLVLGLDQNSSLFALHKQECPNRNCWIPNHLYAGDARENAQDSIKVGTFINVIAEQEKLRTHCPQGHEYSLENTYINPNTHKRFCKECKKINRRSGQWSAGRQIRFKETK